MYENTHSCIEVTQSLIQISLCIKSAYVIKQQNSGGHSSIYALETTYNLVATGPELYEHQRLLYF